VGRKKKNSRQNWRLKKAGNNVPQKPINKGKNTTGKEGSVAATVFSYHREKFLRYNRKNTP